MTCICLFNTLLDTLEADDAGAGTFFASNALKVTHPRADLSALPNQAIVLIMSRLLEIEAIQQEPSAVRIIARVRTFYRAKVPAYSASWDELRRDAFFTTGWLSGFARPVIKGAVLTAAEAANGASAEDVLAFALAAARCPQGSTDFPRQIADGLVSIYKNAPLMKKTLTTPRAHGISGTQLNNQPTDGAIK